MNQIQEPGRRGVTRRDFLRGLGLGALGLAGADLLAACAGAYAAGQFAVEMSDLNRFNPASLRIRRGDTVAWKNTGSVPHTITDDPGKAQDKAHAVLPQGAAAYDSGNINPGAWWSYTFQTPGTYIYFCRHHEAEGMIGVIVVS